MPTILEAIQKFDAIRPTIQERAIATRVSLISQQLQALIDVIDENEVPRKISTLRNELFELSSYVILSEAIQCALQALSAKSPKNDIDLYKIHDDDETIFLTTGYVFGKEWLTKYIQTKGYENPFNRQPFSDQDKNIISAATGLALNYHPSHQHDERLDLTIQALRAEENQRGFFQARNPIVQTFFQRPQLPQETPVRTFPLQIPAELTGNLYHLVADGRIPVDRALQLTDAEQTLLTTGRFYGVVSSGRIAIDRALQLTDAERTLLTTGNLYYLVADGRIPVDRALQLTDEQRERLNDPNVYSEICSRNITLDEALTAGRGPRI